MAAAYPTDYPFYVDDEGWPESVYAPPYPHEYYYDNGQNPYGMDPTTDQSSEYNNDQHHYLHYDEKATQVLPLSIRRHTPGSTDPTRQQLSSRNPSPTSNAHVTFKQNPVQPKPHPSRVKDYSSASSDPDDRPIKPMVDTSIYKKSALPPKKIIQPKTPLPQFKPIPTPSRSEYESESFQPSPSRIRTNNSLPRRPIRADLIPKTPFGISPPPLPQRNRSRPIAVEEYDDYTVTYNKPTPKKIISYQEVPGMTTREMENYQMSKVRRIVRVRPPRIETIIYRN